MKLLIVDDHAGVRALIRQLADAEADDARECTCGADAIRVVAEFSPDVVTMDVRLPDMDGIEAMREIRRRRPAARVVIVTGYDYSALRAFASAAGASDFVAKDHLFELPGVLARMARGAGEEKPPGEE